MKNVKQILTTQLQTAKLNLNSVNTISNSNLSTKQNDNQNDNKHTFTDEEGQADSIDNYDLIEHNSFRANKPRYTSSDYITKLESKVREQARRLTELNEIKNQLNEEKAENENIHKELFLSKEIIASLQAENEEIKENNNYLIKNKDKIKKTLEEGLREMEICKEKVNSLETLREGLQEQIKLLKESNSKLIKENEQLHQQNLNIFEKMEKENFQILEEFKQKTNFEFEEILKDRSRFEKENLKLKEEIEILRKERNHLKNLNSDENISNEENQNLLTEISLHSQINYKKLYEDLKKDFDEYKNSQKLISENFLKNLKNSYDNNEEELLTELYEITQQNNFLIVETKKLEIDSKNLKKEFEQLQNINYKLKNLNEDEIKKSKLLETEKSSLLEQLEKIKKDFSILKESKEAEKIFKNKEIEKLLEELSSNKNQNSKLKEDLKDYLKSENEKFEEIQKLKEKLEEENKKIQKLKENETNLDENLKVFSDNYEKILKKFQQSEKENLNLREKIENLNKDKFEIETEIDKMNKETEELKKQKIDLIQKYQNELNLLNEDLENNLIISEKNFEDYKIQIGELKTQNEKIQKENETVIKQFEEISVKNQKLENNSINLNKIFSELFEILMEYSKKYNSLANQDLNSLLTNNFSKTISSLLSDLNQIQEESNLFDILNFNLIFIKCLTSEFEFCYDKFLEANSHIKENKKTINDLESSFNQLIEKEKRLKLNLKILEDSKEKLENLLTESKENKKNLNEEIQLLKIERENLLKNLKESKIELYNQSQIYKKLIEDYEKIQADYDCCQIELNSLKCKFENVQKDKEFIEGLLGNLGKSYPIKEISKNLNEIIYLIQFIFRTQTEKLKLEGKLKTMEKDFPLFNKDKSSYNSDLSEIMKNEQSNMKELINNYNKKISEKKEIIKKLEKDIQLMQNEFRVKIENANKFECEYQNLLKEYNQIKANTNLGNENMAIINDKAKIMNIYQNNDQNKNIDMFSFDSNAMSICEEKNFNKFAILELTDYQSIEFDCIINTPLQINNEKKSFKSIDTNKFGIVNQTNMNPINNNQNNFQKTYHKKERNLSISPDNAETNYKIMNRNESFQKISTNSYLNKNKSLERNASLTKIRDLSIK